MCVYICRERKEKQRVILAKKQKRLVFRQIVVCMHACNAMQAQRRRITSSVVRLPARAPANASPPAVFHAGMLASEAAREICGVGDADACADTCADAVRDASVSSEIVSYSGTLDARRLRCAGGEAGELPTRVREE